MQRIFVGDVQGCSDELEEILQRAERRFGSRFELWQVGDAVNRGPGSLRALEQIRQRVDSGRGCMVLGNHEIALLEVFFGLRALQPRDTYGEVLDSPDVGDWIDWLRCRPLVKLGDLGGFPFAMVHAAVPPDWDRTQLADASSRVEQRLGAKSRSEAEALLRADPLQDRDADTLRCLTSCRGMPTRQTWSSDEPQEPAHAWHQRWTANRHAYGVVYGHWARQRLHVAPGLRGLDTGCVHHGRGAEGHLTAWIPDEDDSMKEAGHFGPFTATDARFWHVRAHRKYYTSPSPAGVS